MCIPCRNAASIHTTSLLVTSGEQEMLFFFPMHTTCCRTLRRLLGVRARSQHWKPWLRVKRLPMHKRRPTRLAACWRRDKPTKPSWGRKEGPPENVQRARTRSTSDDGSLVVGSSSASFIVCFLYFEPLLCGRTGDTDASCPPRFRFSPKEQLVAEYWFNIACVPQTPARVCAQ